tara:strand:+ start:33565 stop:34077 length:513 start_codon:yes stop_codon:yes gene_type:complete
MLEGQGIELRAWRESDLNTLCALRNDLALQDLLLTQARPGSLERVRRWLVDKSDQEQVLFFVVGRQGSGQCLGYIQLVNLRVLHGTAELGICLAPEAQGKGVGRAALQLLENYAQQVFALRKIVLQVLAEQGAAEFYRRVGYREVGCLQAHAFQNGQYRDVLVMERLLEP